ncbi:MAG: MOSC N-terminal beta barrel domain-containing protein, partial [Antricoccus sp.]
MPTISRLFRYPVKSCRRVELTTAQIESTGISGDREYMIVDAEGVLISQRDVAELALIDPEELVSLAQPSDDVLDIEMHSWRGKGIDQGAAAAKFL